MLLNCTSMRTDVSRYTIVSERERERKFLAKYQDQDLRKERVVIVNSGNTFSSRNNDDIFLTDKIESLLKSIQLLKPIYKQNLMYVKYILV